MSVLVYFSEEYLFSGTHIDVVVPIVMAISRVIWFAQYGLFSHHCHSQLHCCIVLMVSRGRNLLIGIVPIIVGNYLWCSAAFAFYCLSIICLVVGYIATCLFSYWLLLLSDGQLLLEFSLLFGYIAALVLNGHITLLDIIIVLALALLDIVGHILCLLLSHCHTDWCPHFQVSQ